MDKIFDSKFILDGVPCPLTPSQLLAPVLEKQPEASGPQQVLMDESMDPSPGEPALDACCVREYLDALTGRERVMSLPYAAFCTREKVAATLIDTLWRTGNFRLDGMPLTAKWVLDPGRVGELAGFYASVEAAADYIDALGAVVRRHGCVRGSFDVRFATPYSGAPRLVPDVLAPDPQSWVIYLPFDTSEYYLGGSLLSSALGLKGGTAPQVNDADYFMDCFEVVREFAEDGILLSAATVDAGGMLAALQGMMTPDAGCSVHLSGILRSGAGKNPVNILFGEVPGALFQVRDADFDYIDAECLLQDVAYFPLGHPLPGGGLELHTAAGSGIQNILESLMQNAEGED